MYIKPQSRLRRAGYTLVEVMTTVAVSTILLAAVIASNIYFCKSFATLYNYYDLDNSSRYALDVMTADIRQAAAVSQYTTTDIQFRMQDGTFILYSYDATLKKLFRNNNGVRKVLLSNCTLVPGKRIFDVFQRNGPSSTFDNYPPTDGNVLNTIKVVQINWVCSRSVIGLGQTESVQTAKVVIRNNS